MKSYFNYLGLFAFLFVLACGPSEKSEMQTAVQELEVVFSEEPEPRPDYKAPPPQARKKLSEQTRQAAQFMREEKYEEAIGVLSSVRSSQYIDADSKRVIDDAMRKSQKSLARALQSGQLSPQEEARIRRQLGGR